MLEAAKNKQTEIVASCLKKGAQLDAVEDEGGWSALMWAAINGKIDLLQLLIKKGASVYLKDHVGKCVADYTHWFTHPTRSTARCWRSRVSTGISM